MNRISITFKAGKIDVNLGLLCKLPADKLSENFSVMEKNQAMLGIAIFANHCGAPNYNCYTKVGFRGRKAIMLRALYEIKPGQ